MTYLEYTKRMHDILDMTIENDVSDLFEKKLNICKVK